jgi:hypothetical protein
MRNARQKQPGDFRVYSPRPLLGSFTKENGRIDSMLFGRTRSTGEGKGNGP